MEYLNSQDDRNNRSHEKDQNDENDLKVCDFDKLIDESKQLGDIYSMMQKQCNHRLSKIGLFILRLGDLRSLHYSGCKWVNKEQSSRSAEISAIHDDDVMNEVLGLNDELGEIEKTVANVLRKRMFWIKEFVKKVESKYEILEKIYDDISECAVNELELEEERVSTP